LPDYRIYLIDHDGHFHSSVPLPNCVDDETAIEAARQLIDGRDVELWQLDRKVAILDHKTKTLKST
jgi:hypothetical protein